jgi:hypothetical protein
VHVYGIHLEQPSFHREATEGSARAISLRSRRDALAAELVRWAAEDTDERGEQPRSSPF